VVFRSITTVGCRPGPAGSTPRRAREPGGRTLGHAGQACRGGLGSGLGARPRALRSLAASHHAGQAAAPWPLLRTRRERAGHAPRRLRATRWPRRPRTTSALLAALQGAPSWPRRAAEPVPRPRRGRAPAPEPRPRRGRALAPEPRPRRGHTPAPEPRPGHPRRAARAAGAAVSGRAEGRGGEREGEGERRRGRERDVRGIGEGEKEVGERGWADERAPPEGVAAAAGGGRGLGLRGWGCCARDGPGGPCGGGASWAAGWAARGRGRLGRRASRPKGKGGRRGACWACQRADPREKGGSFLFSIFFIFCSFLFSSRC
jgi:hypothetical protein